MNTEIQYPVTGEYDPYYDNYISLVEKGDIIEILSSQKDETINFFSKIPDEKGNYRYAPDKWSIKELAGHLIDSERIFCYRILRLSRGDKTPLPGYDHNDYVKNGKFANRSMENLCSDFQAARNSTIELLKNFDDEDWSKTGTVNNKNASARAIAFALAGHVKHHISVIQEKYF